MVRRLTLGLKTIVEIKISSTRLRKRFWVKARSEFPPEKRSLFLCHFSRHNYEKPFFVVVEGTGSICCTPNNNQSKSADNKNILRTSQKIVPVWCAVQINLQSECYRSFWGAIKPCSWTKLRSRCGWTTSCGYLQTDRATKHLTQQYQTLQGRLIKSAESCKLTAQVSCIAVSYFANEYCTLEQWIRF